MIKKFYTIQTSIDELNCFSVVEIYLRLIADCIPTRKADCIRGLVSEMKANDCLVFDDFKAGRIEIRCWNYYND